MQNMWKRAATLAAAGVAWGMTLGDAAGVMPAIYTAGMDRTVIAVAICATGRLMLLAHTRPVAAAYEMGVERGRRDAIREANRRAVVTPIRRAPGGLGEFNGVHRKRMNGTKIDA